ncbi:MAG: RAD55 family ATPase [Candidatus Zhuqueibacterota bacterium]
MNKTKKIYLSTGIPHLDDLLSQDRSDDEKNGGLYIGEGEIRTDLETPILVIEGTTGTGKTTLALQIAHSATANAKWFVFFYSLEQTYQSLKSVSEHFSCFDEKNELEIDFIDLATFDENLEFTNDNTIYFCHFSPRPFSGKEEGSIYDQRISELNHVLELVSSIDEHNFILFVIDSLTAFAGRPLLRHEIYHLFSLLRNYHVPGIITLERYPNYSLEEEEVTFECTKFLADVVIDLTKDSQTGYLQYFLEIIKSRKCRQALGRHLYKIRTKPIAVGIKSNLRKGLVVYPSIHYVLSKVRAARQTQLPDSVVYKIDNQTEKDLGLILNSDRIKPNSCIAIIGPNGTHKLALGLNLAMGKLSDEKFPNLLVINFGGASDLGFKGIAWTEFNKDFMSLKEIKLKLAGSQTKFWHTCYGIIDMPDKYPPDTPLVTVTSFKIGQLAPEECFNVIETIIGEVNELQRPFNSVLINNTAELRTGFPLLKTEPLFLPTLLDLFIVHNMVSVNIGVAPRQNQDADDENFALLANANFRIVLSHYPTMEQLSEHIVFPEKFKASSRVTEQLVSLVIDNVTGKHYSRQPRWLSVSQITELIEDKEITRKILHCEKAPRPMHPDDEK